MSRILNSHIVIGACLALLLSVVVSSAQPVPAGDQTERSRNGVVIRDDTDLVTLTVTVTDVFLKSQSHHVITFFKFKNNPVSHTHE
jgi:hypothetical protein